MAAGEPGSPGTPPLPTWFVPHGAGPCFFMDWDPPGTWDRMEGFLRGLADSLPRRPRAVLVISAHWLEGSFQLTAGARPGLIYDYYGFPPHTYELEYPAPGDPELAGHAAGLLADAGLPSGQDPERGFDHGLFIPMKLLFPNADLPVVQLSLHNGLDPATHLQAGRALAPLRHEDVLILGSGMSFHNMRGYGDPQFGPVSDAFDQWLTAAVEAPPEERNRALAHWDEAPAARQSHPPAQEEHLLPLMVAAGAAGRDAGQRIFSDRVMETTISAFRFG